MESNTKLADLILEGEHTQQDFKFEISDSRKIARSLCAFANTIGGRLLVGIKDNGNVAGVRTDEEFYMVESAAHIFSHPKIEFTTYTWDVNGKTVLQIDISESKSKPHFVKNSNGTLEAYVRVNDENIQAPDILIALWKKKRQPRGSVIRYSHDEEKLFSYLKTNKTVTSTAFQQIAGISEKEATDTLANMLLFDVLEYEYSDNIFHYYLKD